MRKTGRQYVSEIIEKSFEILDTVPTVRTLDDQPFDKERTDFLSEKLSELIYILQEDIKLSTEEEEEEEEDVIHIHTSILKFIKRDLDFDANQVYEDYLTSTQSSTSDEDFSNVLTLQNRKWEVIRSYENEITLEIIRLIRDIKVAQIKINK